MKEFELKYGCNPNQKPSKIFMENGNDLPIENRFFCNTQSLCTPFFSAYQIKFRTAIIAADRLGIITPAFR